MRVRAAVVREPGGPFAIEELALDAPRSDEVLVEVEAVGLCHTDIAVRDRWLPVPLPLVLGHEGCGVVRAVGGSVTTVAPGDRVVMTYWACGVCRFCRRGHPAYCVDHAAWTTGGSRPDGSNALQDGIHGFFFAQSSFATHAIATERNVVRIGADVDPAVAAPLACGVQTGAGTVLNRLRPEAGSSLAVFGVGAVGLAAVMAARLVGCSRIVAVDREPGRLRLAAELGATDTLVAPAPAELAAAVRERVAGGVDHAVETTAVPAVAAAAVDSLAKLGCCAILGLGPAGSALETDMTAMLSSGRTVTGVTMGDGRPGELLPALLDLHGQGRFPLDRLVTRYPLGEIERAVADVEAGLTVKAVLLPAVG